MPEVSQTLLNEKLDQINLGMIADSASQTVEDVQLMLAGIRDEVIDSIFLRKLNVQLDFGIGILTLSNQKTI